MCKLISKNKKELSVRPNDTFLVVKPGETFTSGKSQKLFIVHIAFREFETPENKKLISSYLEKLPSSFSLPLMDGYDEKNQRLVKTLCSFGYVKGKGIFSTYYTSKENHVSSVNYEKVVFESFQDKKEGVVLRKGTVIENNGRTAFLIVKPANYKDLPSVSEHLKYDKTIDPKKLKQISHGQNLKIQSFLRWKSDMLDKGIHLIQYKECTLSKNGYGLQYDKVSPWGKHSPSTINFDNKK